MARNINPEEIRAILDSQIAMLNEIKILTEKLKEQNGLIPDSKVSAYDKVYDEMARMADGMSCEMEHMHHILQMLEMEVIYGPPLADAINIRE